MFQKIATDKNDNIKMLNKMIYPFMYGDNNENYEEYVAKYLNDSSKWIKKTKNISLSGSELYSHIEKLISNETLVGSSIGIRYTLEKNYLKGEADLTFDSRDKTIKVYLGEVDLIFFETGIAFLVIEISYDTQEVDDLIKCNNVLKKIRDKDKKIVFNFNRFETINKYINENEIHSEFDKDTMYEVHFPATKNRIGFIEKNLVDVDLFQDLKIIYKKNQPELIYTKLTKMGLGEIIKDLISDIKNIRFFNTYKESKGVDLPTKANIFSSVLVEAPFGDEEFKLNFYRFRKGYDEKYIPTNESLNITNNNEVFEPFNGNIWGFSREAMVNLVRLDNVGNKNYYLYGYKEKLRGYEFIYLLILHQYYGLISFSRQMSELPGNLDYYKGRDGKKSLRKLKRLLNEINFFYMKCVYQELSHISHQNKLYKQLHQALGINDMMNELDYESRTISNIIISDHDNRKASSMKIFAIIAGLFALISSFNSVWVLANHYKAENNSEFFLNPEIVITIVVVMAAIAFGFLVWLIEKVLNAYD